MYRTGAWVMQPRKNGRRGLATDRGGGIEGLPLQLLIMVVVAGLGLTVIVGWMNSIAAPHSIGQVFVSPSQILVYDEDGDGIYVQTDLTVTVVVTDQSGDRLEGATVILEGANIRSADGSPVKGLTDERGQVVFFGLAVEQFGRKLTTVTVTVAKGDYGVDSSYEIPVIPG